MKLIFALLLISTIGFGQSGTLSPGMSLTYSTPSKEGVNKVTYYDILITDSLGNKLAWKEHGKEWVFKDAKKAIEILYKEVDAGRLSECSDTGRPTLQIRLLRGN